MTDDEARQLATQIVKQGDKDVRVRIGRTNGKPCFHLKHGKQSTTIYALPEWTEHPANRANQRKTREERDDEPIFRQINQTKEQQDD